MWYAIIGTDRENSLAARLESRPAHLARLQALAAEVEALKDGKPALVDFVLGNTKARMRMVAQYTIAGARGGLVIGTDHAAEAVISTPLH